MKLILALTCAGLTGVAAQQLLPSAAGACAPDVLPYGLHVDARSASVFAGGCHANSEFASQGRRALLGWRLDGGRQAGVDLSGVTLAAAVSSERNLREGAARRAVVYLDSHLSAAAAEAALDWLRSNHADVLGEVVAVRRVPVRLEVDGESFELVAGDRIALTGELLADRSCCTMPESVWYAPLFADARGAIVANAERCSFAGTEGLVAWSYQARNNTFVARFGTAPDA